MPGCFGPPTPINRDEEEKYPRLSTSLEHYSKGEKKWSAKILVDKLCAVSSAGFDTELEAIQVALINFGDHLAMNPRVVRQYNPEGYDRGVNNEPGTFTFNLPKRLNPKKSSVRIGDFDEKDVVIEGVCPHCWSFESIPSRDRLKFKCTTCMHVWNQ